jgi:geranylgeranyl reductase family protein
LWGAILKFDVIVAGAGTAGCMTAKAVADAGLKVCLIDRKGSETIGEKVCGDAVGRHHFDKLGLAYPKDDELRNRIGGIKIYSPNMETVFHVEGEGLFGFILNRHMFGQRLLKDALDVGVTLLESTIVTEPVLKDGFVNGLIAKDVKKNGKLELQCKVVVDASGFTAVLRKKLPPEIGIIPSIDYSDVEACYREIRNLAEPREDPEFCEIYLNQTTAPKGYYWIFPEGKNMINVGLGVAMTKGFPNPKVKLYREVLSKPMFKGSKVITGGTWYVPTRRPLDCMTGNGIVAVGDSACQVNPIHGGGIGPSMMAGRLAGETIVDAIEKEDLSRQGLWQYNVKYMRSYGAKQAGLDVFRLFLLNGVTNEDLNYGLKYRLIKEDDVLKVSMGENLNLNITEKTRRAFRGFGKISLLLQLREAASLLARTKALYMKYPDSPNDFEEWKRKAEAVIGEAKMRLSKK